MDFNNFFDLNYPEDKFRIATYCLMVTIVIILYIWRKRLERDKLNQDLIDVRKRVIERLKQNE